MRRAWFAAVAAVAICVAVPAWAHDPAPSPTVEWVDPESAEAHGSALNMHRQEHPPRPAGVRRHEPGETGRARPPRWDSGFIALDLTDPARPTFKGRTVYPANADGDAHSSDYDDDRRLLFSADEDFCKTSGPSTEKGFGYLRVWDYSKPAAPRQIATFKTPNASGSEDMQAGDYTIHNPLFVDGTLYISWYTDGIRVVDARDPRGLREVAHFVPPAVNNPIQPSQRGVLTNTTQVWGVAYDKSRDLVYASDMNSGLWILRRTDR